MIKQLSWLAAALLFAASPAIAGDKLAVGDPAPKIEVSKWVKGQPVGGFEKGHVYVVEFWATWCGPCKVSIPHLTELQKKFANATFVGVSVWEKDQSLVEPFVEKMGEKMSYRVAMDSVAEGAKPNEGKMASTWMTAAGQGGIPTAFVVNGDGRVAWIGHPSVLERPLSKVLDGTWDIQAEIKRAAAQSKVAQAMKARDAKAALAAIDEAITTDPAFESEYGMTKFQLLLVNVKDYAAAYAYGEKLLDGALKNDEEKLNGLAWTIVNPKLKGVETRDLKLALRAASRANELAEGKNPAILDTLAKVIFDSGNIAQAIEIQQKALDLATDPDMKSEMAETLEQYKKAAKPKG